MRTFRRVRPSERGGADLLRSVCAPTSRPGKCGHRHQQRARARHFSSTRTWDLSRRSSARKNWRRLKGTRAIGHTRYSTTGTSTIKNAQPFVVDCVRGQMAIAHNGNLINADVLRDELERKGSIFQTPRTAKSFCICWRSRPKNGGSVLARCAGSKAHFRFSS